MLFDNTVYTGWTKFDALPKDKTRGGKWYLEICGSTLGNFRPDLKILESFVISHKVLFLCALFCLGV